MIIKQKARGRRPGRGLSITDRLGVS